jgi:hypothetical protein
MTQSYSIYLLLFYLEVGDVSPAPLPLPDHDVAGPSLDSDMDLLKAKTRTGGSEASPGLGGADVAVHSCPMDGEEPAT